MIVAVASESNVLDRAATAAFLADEWSRRGRETLLIDGGGHVESPGGVDRISGLGEGPTLELVADLRRLAGHYDRVVVDCSSDRRQSERAAASAANVCVVPWSPNGAEVGPSDRTMEIVRRAEESREGLDAGLLALREPGCGSFDESGLRAIERAEMSVFDTSVAVRAESSETTLAPYQGVAAADEIEALVDEIEQLDAPETTGEARPRPRAAE